MSEQKPTLIERCIPTIASARYILLCGGLSLGAGAAFGGIIDGLAYEKPYDVPEYGVNDYASYVKFVEKTNELQADLQEYEDRFVGLSKVVGSTCLQALDLYTTGEPLASTPIDSIVDDMLRTSGLPCGEEPSEVRYNVSEVRHVTDEFESLNKINMNERLKYVRDLQEADARTIVDDRDKSPAKSGMKIGFMVGLIASTISELSFRKANKGSFRNTPYDIVFRKGKEEKRDGLELVHVVSDHRGVIFSLQHLIRRRFKK